MHPLCQEYTMHDFAPSAKLKLLDLLPTQLMQFFLQNLGLLVVESVTADWRQGAPQTSHLDRPVIEMPQPLMPKLCAGSSTVRHQEQAKSIQSSTFGHILYRQPQLT